MGNRILVVDDEKQIRDFLFEALTQLGGLSIELAENGEEALKKIEKERGRFSQWRRAADARHWKSINGTTEIASLR